MAHAFWPDLASSAKWTYGFAELSANPKRGTFLSYFANEEQDRKSLVRSHSNPARTLGSTSVRLSRSFDRAFGLSSRRQHGGICAQAQILPLPHNLMFPPPILDRAFALSSRRQHMEASMHRLKSYPCHTISCSHCLSSHSPTPVTPPPRRHLLRGFCIGLRQACLQPGG